MEIKMATTKSISGNATKNNGGYAVQIGTSTVLNSLGLGLDNPATGSVVIDGDDTDKSVDSEVFAKNTQRPLGQRLSDSPSLVGGSSYPRYFRQINSIESFDSPGTATAFRAGYFNLYTGKWSTNPTVTYDNMHKAVVGTSNIDNAAHVTRSNTGSLTYLSGSKIPVNQNYESKRS
jgi:hypothetical protein